MQEHYIYSYKFRTSHEYNKISNTYHFPELTAGLHIK